MSLTVIVIDKEGELKEVTIKNYSEAELYKKCGYKKPDGFVQLAEWKKAKSLDDSDQPTKTVFNVILYGKSDGKPAAANKYDLPPPADVGLFYGSLAVVLKRIVFDRATKSVITAGVVDLTLELWEEIYEKLFGGFEDLDATRDADEAGEDSEADAAEEDEDEDIEKTADGYNKDGFVVSDDEYSEGDGGDDDVASDVEVDDIGGGVGEDADDDDDEEPKADFDDVDDEDTGSTVKKGRRGAGALVVAKRGGGAATTATKKKKGVELSDLSHLEQDELIADPYLSTDDEGPL